MDFDNVFLYITSTIAGLWNMLHVKFVSYRQSICLFILGFMFCVIPAKLLSCLGYDATIGTCVGYICGVLSTKVYTSLSKCLDYLPELFYQRLGGRKGEKDNGDNGE
jgi:hypothetical protein